MFLACECINWRLCQEEIAKGKPGGGVGGFYRTGASGTRLCEDAVQVDGENSNSEDKAGDRGVLERGVP